MVHNEVTYGQLEELLLQLGFVRQDVGSQWHRYEHAVSDTEIILAAKPPTEPARPSEVASARIHLVAKGLIREAELDQQLGHNTAQKTTPGAKKRSASVA
jgi:hypothetical protein